jgi:hypothetical protein
MNTKGKLDFVLNNDKLFYVWEFKKLKLFKQPKLSE